MDAPWEHPDWYDLHDTTHTAGPEREPEHYRELVIALPPLDQEELQAEITRAGFEDVVCVYRFRDRVVLRARKPDAPDTPEAPETP